MKNLTLFLIVIFCAVTVHAQSVYLVEQKKSTQETSAANMLVFKVCEDNELAEKDLKDFIKDRYSLKMKNNTKYSLIAEAVSIPSISPYRGDLICYFHHTDTGNAAAIGFAMGYDIYLNSEDNADGMNNFRELVKDFMTYHFQTYYKASLDDLEKQLKDTNKEIHKRESDINGLKKDVINLDKKILKEEDELKIQKMETEKLTSNQKIELLYNELPPFKEQLTSIETKIDEKKKELNTYSTQITQFE